MKGKYTKINAKQAKEMMENDDVIVVDVRNQEEYETGHIKNSILIPLNTISKKAPALLQNKDSTILVYCRSGRRSAMASQQLAKMGYSNIYDFGGIIDWPYEIEK